MGDNYDNESVSFDEGGGEPAAAPKAKGGGAGILRILMFVGIGIALVALIVTIVVITVGVLNKQGAPLTDTPVSESYQAATPQWAYFKNIPSIRARTADPEPRSVVAKVVLGYDEAEKDLPTELTARLTQMQDRLRNFFAKKLAEDLTPDRETRLKEEIRELINRMLSKPAIKEILFEDLQVVEQ